MLRFRFGIALAAGAGAVAVALTAGCGAHETTEAPDGGNGGASGVVTTTTRTGPGAGAGGGGDGGAGGGDSMGPECRPYGADCRRVSDCCSCTAVPSNGQAPACSSTSCAQTKCDEMELNPNVPPIPVDPCVAGRCVVGFDCDAFSVNCGQPPPACPAGETPQVRTTYSGDRGFDRNTCYTGRCVPVLDCVSVTSCAVCGTSLGCISTQEDDGQQRQYGLQFHCVPIPPECNGRASCACLGKRSCVGVTSVCVDNPQSGGDFQCKCPSICYL